MLERRSLLAGASALAVLTAARATFAAAPTDRRFVLVLLRGALDGLHALPPHGDKDYRRLRPTLALPPDAALDLDGRFGLHPALGDLMPLYRAGELLFVPAAATRYRDRSHFDGQNMLENGSGKPYGAPDGWLNRAILGLNGGDRRLGLALGPAVPLILQGPARIRSWSESGLPAVDEDFLSRMTMAYRNDPLFAAALGDARGRARPAAGMGDATGDQVFVKAAAVAADLLARSDGPRVAVLESQGWDTHFAQERRLKVLLRDVARGLLELKRGLGEAWRETVVLVVSEFGRTAAENASGGTDHGTGGLAILAGGAVAGGRIAGDWPGLSDRALHEGRDVPAANAYERLFKAALIRHLGLDAGFVEDRVFPASRALSPLDGLLRRA
ncbi:MAG: DUF1501 domain-containing protein [Alphaproteobacteria bacterium]|nr:DUF1501 domain-containing protein [Alphaproteobacteria bacterium]MCW5741348.1 DUF1501 domain-containing protein [Alphaproteobacteria bacterium]